MENNKNKVYNYQGISLKDLREIVDIKPKLNASKFDDWFSYKYKISEDEQKFLEELIKCNILYLPKYNETKLLVKFIAPLLNRVNFIKDDIRDWYENFLSGEVNGHKFNGKTDFMVAKGIFEPEKPYFFIQEFKQSLPTSNPEFQLLAEMLVAIEINKKNIIHGCFIIGKNWDFVVLEKLENGDYEYFVSKSFNCLETDDLQQIYINLQAAKDMFCKE